MSPRTVEFHKYNLISKLKLKTTAALIQYAIKQGIIAVEDLKDGISSEIK
jgi:DNA-binding CsgD family transcriptional regulator